MQVRRRQALVGCLCKADFLRWLLVTLLTQPGKIQQVESGRTGLQDYGSLQASQVTRVLDSVYDPT